MYSTLNIAININILAEGYGFIGRLSVMVPLLVLLLFCPGWGKARAAYGLQHKGTLVLI